MGTFDFSNIADHKPQPNREETYVFEDLRGEPEIVLRHAGKTTPAYYSAMLRKVNMKRLARATKTKSAEKLARVGDEKRTEDKELFAKYLVVSWSGVRDASGAEVPFSEAACLEFFEALPEVPFDEMRAFANDAANFNAVQEDTEDVEETAKN